MNCTRNNIQYLPEEKNRRMNQENEINDSTFCFKNIVSKEVKDLKESIYSFKLQIEPIELKKEEERKRILKDKLQQIKTKKEKERRERFNRLNFLQKNYSNMMILQEMTKRNCSFSNNNKDIDKSALSHREKEIEQSRSGIGSGFGLGLDLNNRPRRNNNSSMFLTTFKHEPSTEAIMSIMRNKTKSEIKLKPSPSFNMSICKNQSQSKSGSCSVSANLSQSKLRTNNQRASSANDNLRGFKNNSFYSKNFKKLSRNLNHINEELNQTINTTIIKEMEKEKEKNKSSIENIFKRSASCHSCYANIKSKVSSNKISNKGNELPHQYSHIKNPRLLNGILSTKLIEQKTLRLSFAINSERDEMTKLKQSIKESIDKGIRLQVNPESEEIDKMKLSMQSDMKKVKIDEFEYAIQMKIKNQDYNGLSNLNNDVAYINRKYIKKRLGLKINSQ